MNGSGPFEVPVGFHQIIEHVSYTAHDNGYTCRECGARVDEPLTHSKFHNGLRNLLEKVAGTVTALVNKFVPKARP